MKSRLITVLIALVAVGFLVAAAAAAQEKLLCVSNQELQGQETVSSCLAKGERFAVVDQYGLVRILTPEEVALSQAFNPKVFESRAFGVRYYREAPSLPPLPVSPEIPGG
jgi:hypothetical protein